MDGQVKKIVDTNLIKIESSIYLKEDAKKTLPIRKA